MIAFLLNNLATILISIALAAVVALIIVRRVRQYRKGKANEDCAGCNIAGCPYCRPRRNL